MWYRLQVGTADGLECGYQWREIDLDLFEAIMTGERPLADEQAQTRDSTEWNTAAQNRPMHYLAVWDPLDNHWAIEVENPAEAYAAWAGTGPGA